MEQVVPGVLFFGKLDGRERIVPHVQDPLDEEDVLVRRRKDLQVQVEPEHAFPAGLEIVDAVSDP
jgi:hypothetical protein